MLGVSAVQGGIGALANRGQTQTSESTTTRNLTPEQQMIMQMLTAQNQSMMMDPMAHLQPFSNQMMSDVAYGHMANQDALNEQLAQRGIRPDSGVAVGGIRALLSERSRRTGQVSNTIAQMALEQQAQGRAGMGRLLDINMGQTTRTKGKTPGNMLAGGAGAAAESFGYFARDRWGGK
jgi:hypothetical protein